MGTVSPSARRLVVLLALAAAAALMYGPTLGAPFFSDDYQIAGLLRDPASGSASLDPARVWGDFLTPWFGLRENAYYRPLLTLSAAWDWVCWGGRPLGFRLTNLLAHVLNAWLVGRILVEILGSRARGAGVLAGFLFVLHPAGPEAVAWIAGRVDTLTFLPLLAALLLHLRATRSGRLADRLGSLAALVAALLCKESAVLLPGLAIVADGAREIAGGGPRAIRATTLRRLAPFWVSLAAVVVVYLGLRAFALDLPLLPPASPVAESWIARFARLPAAWILPLHADVWQGTGRLLAFLMALFVLPPLGIRLAGDGRPTLARLGFPLAAAGMLALPALALSLGPRLEGTRLLYESNAAVAVALALLLSPLAAPLPARRADRHGAGRGSSAARGDEALRGGGGGGAVSLLDPRVSLFRLAAGGVLVLYAVALHGNLMPWREGAAIVREVSRSLGARSREASQRAREEGLQPPTPGPEGPSLLEASRPAFPFAVLEAPYHWKGVPLLHANVLGLLTRPPFGKEEVRVYPLAHAAVEGDATLLPAIREAGIPLAGWSLRTQTFAWKPQPPPISTVRWVLGGGQASQGPPTSSTDRTREIATGYTTSSGEAGRAILTLSPPGDPGPLAIRFEVHGEGASIPGARIEAIRLVLAADPDAVGPSGTTARPAARSGEAIAGEVRWTAGRGDPLRAYRRAPIARRQRKPLDPTGTGSPYPDQWAQGCVELIAAPSRSLLWSLEAHLRGIEIQLPDSLASLPLLEVSLLGRLPRLDVTAAALAAGAEELRVRGDPGGSARVLRATWLGVLGDRTFSIRRVEHTPSAGPPATSPTFRIDPADREFLEVTRRFAGPPLAVLLEEVANPEGRGLVLARSDLLPVRVP